MATDVAKVHLTIYGQEHEIELVVHVGEVPLLDLFEPAAELSRRVSAIAVERASAEGRTVRCSRGCDACCRQLVPISIIEARRLADLVATLPEDHQAIVRGRFAAIVARLEANGLLDTKAARGRSSMTTVRTGNAEALWLDVSRRYFELRLDCPFLEDGACSVYTERPLTCREYHVTTPPERCATLSGAVEAVDRPVRMSAALGAAASALLGVQATQIPMALALEWAEIHGTDLDARHSGEEAFFALVRAAGEDGQTPAQPPRQKPGNKAKAKRRR